MAPPGRQKSEREFCLFGGGFLRPMRRAACRGGRSCAACRCCEDFCARCPGVFSAGVLLSCPRLAGSLLLLCLACAAGACRLPAMRLCVRGFCCRCLACLARCTGVQGGAAARRLCVRLPAVMSAFCGFSLPAFRGVVSWPACSAAFVSGLARPALPLPAVCPPRALCARVLSLVFHLFLLNFFLSNLFSLVAQAATGLYFLPKRK